LKSGAGASRLVGDGTKVVNGIAVRGRDHELAHRVARAVVRRRYLVAAPNSTDRSIVAADGDSVASVVAVPVIPTTVVVTVAVSVSVSVTVTPHSHIASGGFNSNLCGSGRNNPTCQRRLSGAVESRSISPGHGGPKATGGEFKKPVILPPQ
jgi:hypothetical protein